MKRLIAVLVLVAGLSAGCGLCTHGSTTTTTAPEPTTTTQGGPGIQICPPLCR